MKRDSTLTHSETDWEYLRNLPDSEIDLSDIPEITPEQMKRAVMRIGGKPVSPEKVRVNMYLDADLVAYFRARAGGRGYQTLINETLRQSVGTYDLEAILRRVIREELSAAK
jgi:uncharacterized protein (DUF4415 family)